MGRGTRRRLGLPEGLAALAGMAVAVLGVVALGGGGGSIGRQLRLSTMRSETRGSRVVAHRATMVLAPTVGPGRRAVQAATLDLLALSRAGYGNIADARRIVDAIAMGSLRTQLASALTVVGSRVRARVTTHGTPAAFETWPLGYRLRAASNARAVVEIWHLDVAATSALGLAGAEYQTTAFTLVRQRGDWMIEAAATSPGPTPPAPSAPGTQLDAFAAAANSFLTYHDVP